MSIIQTNSGKMVDVANPKPGDVCLRDIAVPLSRLARFNGHTRGFYSVAQHSVLVSLAAQEMAAEQLKGLDEPQVLLEAARWGLFHDAHEAWIGDIPRPLKELAGRLCACALELDDAVRAAFGLSEISLGVLELVRDRDAMLLATEKRDLLVHQAPWNGTLPEPWKHYCIGTCLLPDDALRVFLARHDELYRADTALNGLGDSTPMVIAAGLANILRGEEKA